MLPRPYRIHLLSLVMLLGLSGCASWFGGDYNDPEVSLVKVHLLRAKLLEQRFLLSFQIDNPNDSHLHVRGLSYAIHLDSMLLTEGDYDESFVVKPHGSKIITVVADTNLWQNLKGIARLLRKHHQPIPYNLDGQLRSGSFLFGHDVHVVHNGEIIPDKFLPE